MQPQEEYLTWKDAVEYCKKRGVSESKLYRNLSEISSLDIKGKNVKKYLKSSLETFCNTVTQEKKNPSKRNALQRKNLQVDWASLDDLLYIFVLESELRHADNITTSSRYPVSPNETQYWYQKNPYLSRILFEKSNRKEILAVLSILPMKETAIHRFLTAEIQNIMADDILEYRTGQKYIGYISSISFRPDHHKHIFSLLKDFTDYWCSQSISIQNVYAHATYGKAETDNLRFVRELAFWPRFDIDPNVWELRLDCFHPNPIIQQFQKCLEKQNSSNEKDSVLTAAPPKRKRKVTSEQRQNFQVYNTPSAEFRVARSREDFTAMVDIEGEIFDSKTLNDEQYVDLWYSWHQKNPEMFYVLEEKTSNDLIGFVSILPLTREKIDNILTEKETPSNIQPEDIKRLECNQPLDYYIHVMGVHPRFKSIDRRTYGMRLVKGLIDIFINWGHRGIVINSISTRSRMEDGIELLRHIGFHEYSLPEVNKRLFSLEATDNTSLEKKSHLKNVFLHEYQQAFTEYQAKSQ